MGKDHTGAEHIPSQVNDDLQNAISSLANMSRHALALSDAWNGPHNHSHKSAVILKCAFADVSSSHFKPAKSPPIKQEPFCQFKEQAQRNGFPPLETPPKTRQTILQKYIKVSYICCRLKLNYQHFNCNISAVLINFQVP